MAANVNIVVNAQDRASSTLRRIRGAFGEILQVALGIRLSQVFNRAGEAVRDFATNSIDAAASLQMFQIGVETLIAREQLLADSTVEVGDAFAYAASISDDYIKDLQTIALLSPYQFADVQKMFRQAMAFGFLAEEAKTFTEATLNVAAGVGASNQQMDRMAYNLAQIRLQGKVTKLDIRQLALAGFDLLSVLRYVGDQMDVAVDTHLDFNKAIKSGEITWADFTRLYAEYADTYFGGASERMARTMFGLRNTFKDIFAVTMPQILGPTLDAITTFTSELLDKLLELRDSGTLEAWGESIKENFDKNWKPILDYILLGKYDPDSGLIKVLEMLRDFAQHGFAGSRSDTGASIWKYLFEDMTGIDPQPIINRVKEIITSIRSIMSDPTGEGGITGIAALLGIDPQVIAQIYTTIGNTIQMLKEKWQTFVEVMQPFIAVFQNVFVPLWKVIGGILLWIGQTVGAFLINTFKMLGEWFAENSDLIAWWWEKLQTVFGTLSVLVLTVFKGLLTFLLPIITGIMEYWLNLAGAITAFLQGDWERAKTMFMDSFSALWDGILQGIADFITEFVVVLTGIWVEHIAPVVAEWIANAVTAGADWISGLVEGFLSGVDAAITAVEEGLGKVIDKAKTILGIDSPSKVFEEIGMQSMQGFVAGFKPNTMISAGLTQGAIPAMQSAGMGGGTTVINQHYHGLTLNDRLQAETILRPIVKKITR